MLVGFIMDEDRRIVAVLWLSHHIDEPRGLRNRVYRHEDDWDWNIGQTPTDPILGIPLYWDKNRGCYIPYPQHLLEEHN